jgi:hypothetical protein
MKGADGVVSCGTTPPFAKKRANGTPPNLRALQNRVEFS